MFWFNKIKKIMFGIFNTWSWKFDRTITFNYWEWSFTWNSTDWIFGALLTKIDKLEKELHSKIDSLSSKKKK